MPYSETDTRANFGDDIVDCTSDSINMANRSL